MKKFHIYLLVVLTTCLLGCQSKSVGNSSVLKVTSVTIEHLTNPLNVDSTSPRISWINDANYNGAKQTAFEIKVSSSPKNTGDMWNSGLITSNASFDIEYAGKPLASMQRYFVSVRTYDNDVASEWSSPTWCINTEFIF